ncbi:MAG TPA: hydrogenase maturation nickel metallochaperone HypA [Verrucomicrobia bacterium]|nr:MAG: hydrogenase maturation nickel metallochaperone HypA [Lentisphaerae bacterium GWF2_57_35]HBA83861.1 hydrogenase maturation nickel metallochaperone HypA [Verrucomicrobiota bacterium]
MHELSLMENTLAIVFEEARRHGSDRVTGLRMRVGSMSGVVPEALEFAFEALTEGTPAAGAKLYIERIPLACYCSACGNEFEPPPHSFECPVCKTPSMDIRKGRELEIISIEVP